MIHTKQAVKTKKPKTGLSAREKTITRISYEARDLLREEARLDGRQIHHFLEDVLKYGIEAMREKRGDRSSDVLETETQ